MKRQTTVWDKISANDMITKVVISKINKWLIHSILKKKKKKKQKVGRRPEQTFFQRRIPMADRHMKSCSILLIIREMQIKTTMRNHLTPIIMAIIKKYTNNKCWRGCEEKGIFVHCWWECKLVQPLWRTVWRFLN